MKTEIEKEFEKRMKRGSRRMITGAVVIRESEFRSVQVRVGLKEVEVDREWKTVLVRSGKVKGSKVEFMEMNLTFKNIRDLMKKIS